MERTHDEPAAVASFDVAPELADLAAEDAGTPADRAATESVPDGDEAA